MTDCITDQIIGLMMDWIMSTEIRNFAWLPRIKSVCRPHWEFFFFVHSKSDYMEFWGKKWACTPFCHADSLLASYATSQIFIEHMLIFSPPPPPHFFFKTLFFCKQFPCFIFQTSFFWSVIQSKRFWAKKYFQWGLHSIMSSRSYFGSSHIISNFS